ncbi:MAG: VanZ family protein [Lachnospiraceae bacterium]|nr:VanZ family protein [Lachnospiraceae bacterium]
MGIIKQYFVGIIFYSILGATISFSVCKIRKINNNKIIIGITLYCSYLFALLSLTVFPRIDVGILSDTGRIYVDFISNPLSNSSLNAIPFRSVINYLKDLFFSGNKDLRMLARLNITGNIIVYIPMGLIPSLILHEKRIGLIVLITFITSLSIEFIQLFIGRSSDIDDIGLNIIGSIIGYLICTLINQIKKIKRYE